ncbi:MAG: hypothetical protein D0531_05245 [Methylococcales bacterium]|nr:MAG: hypothetical protein D0531_05245 [Methylococcales bacterium]
MLLRSIIAAVANQKTQVLQRGTAPIKLPLEVYVVVEEATPVTDGKGAGVAGAYPRPAMWPHL